MLRAVIGKENARDDASIRLIAQPEENILMELLATAGRANQGLHLEHVVCFQQSVGNSSENRYNIETFRNILSLFVSGCDYKPLYYYDDVSARFSDTTILPYLLITSESCVAFSKKLGCPHLMRSSDVVKLYDKMYLKVREAAKPLISVIQDASSLIDLYFGAFDTIKEDNYTGYSLIPCPCLCYFLNEAMLNRYIRSDLPSAKDVKHKYMMIMRDVYSVLKTKSLVSYFSETGLETAVCSCLKCFLRQRTACISQL